MNQHTSTASVFQLYVTLQAAIGPPSISPRASTTMLPPMTMKSSNHKNPLNSKSVKYLQEKIKYDTNWLDTSVEGGIRVAYKTPQKQQPT